MNTQYYRAALENLFAHVAFVQSRTPGMLVRDLGGALLVDSGLPSDTFNKVLWECDGSGLPCRLDPQQAGEPLQAAADWFAGKRPRDLLLVPGAELPPATERPFIVWAGAEDSGALNRQQTQFGRLGYSVGERETGMALPLNLWTPPDTVPEWFRIFPVKTAAQLSACAEVIAANWSPPDEAVKTFYKKANSLVLQAFSPMRLFVALAGDVPVGCGEVFLSENGNIAGLHMICTREPFRGRGVAGAMTAALLQEGRAAGASCAVLQASDAGKSVYARQGFVPCGLFTEYAPGDEILF